VNLQIPSYTRISSITKFMLGGCQSSLQMSTNMHTIFAAASQRKDFPAMYYHRWWNVCAPLWMCKQTPKHGVETHHPSPRMMKFKSVHSASKVLLTLFWDFNGPILQHYQDCGQMVNSAWYCAMLMMRWNLLFAINTDKCWQMELFHTL